VKLILREISRALLLVAAVSFMVGFCLCFTGCSIVPQGKKWWNPTTWFSASEHTSQQAALGKEASATKAVEAFEGKVVHAAHIEWAKAALVISFLPESQDATFAGRFARNGLHLLDQVDPLTAAENAELFALVSDLRSSDVARRERAEKRQGELEAAQLEMSKELERLRARLAQATTMVREKNERLADAFIRENELADTLRNQRFIMWAAIGGFVLFAGLSLYLRIGLGSVGAGLRGLQPILGKEKFESFIIQMDAGTDWLHQKLIGSGRAAADKAHEDALAKAAAERARLQASIDGQSTP
jgi:hypothetical protein